MAHSALLGDSIFDNAPYVPAGTEVRAQLQSLLGPQHQVSEAQQGDRMYFVLEILFGNMLL